MIMNDEFNILFIFLSKFFKLNIGSYLGVFIVGFFYIFYYLIVYGF